MSPPPISQAAVPEATFETQLAARLKDGWKVSSDGPSGVQLLEPKRMRFLDKCVCVLAVALVWAAWPLSVLLLLAVAFDYALMTPRRIEFLMRPAPAHEATQPPPVRIEGSP